MVALSKGRIFIPVINTFRSMQENGLLEGQDLGADEAEGIFADLLMEELGIEAAKPQE